MIRAMLALLICSGCAMQFDLTARGDAAPTLTPTVVVTDAALVDAVSEAARNWQDGTVNGAAVAAPQVVLADTCDGAPPGAWCVSAVPAAQLPEMCRGVSALGCETAGDTAHIGPISVKLPMRTRIYVSDSISKYEIVSTVMHEFGHAFGLEHAPEGLMNPGRSGSERKNPRVDATTLAAFEAIAAPAAR